MGVLVISFDSVGDTVFQAMAGDSERYPNVAVFRQEAYYQGGIKTVFVSNTYPVHTTVSTGRQPKDHGIISNLLPPQKNGCRPWAQMAKYIKSPTIWDAAKKKKLSTAAMLWPVTCGADIDYHMPEVHVEKGQNLLLRSLRYGSVLFQLSALFSYGAGLVKALKSIRRGSAGQPDLDNFTTAVTCGVLRRKKPDLALVHLIAYDTLFHYAGSGGREMDIAKKAMDTNLGKLLESAKDYTVIVFSDHSQIDVDENVDLSVLYGDTVFEQCGGCAFLSGEPEGLEREPWFGRYLSKEEMKESGYMYKPVFGIAAKPGYVFSENGGYKGAHGYPADYEGYRVFYGVRGNKFTAGHEHQWLKGHITDVTAIIARELGLDMDIPEEYGEG
ncbi:MAG: alkaline phosphatase family protein [Treponema sp.]|nr:alkaline phosphatase family protein [Treponema sp.]